MTLLIFSFHASVIEASEKAVSNDTPLKNEKSESHEALPTPKTPQKTPSNEPSEKNTPANDASSPSYSCYPKKRCYEMASCEEAKHHCFVCGNHDLDRDKDGIPCEKLCGRG
ncbi:MAG: excalibur calcium-binding domain-containing protein [Alphaproteobacteria bacterium]|nr:excalibur calcium-binding domain-containing protein [Alphaproteobacteria bacterium]